MIIVTFFKLCSQKLSNLDFSSSRSCMVCRHKKEKKSNKKYSNLSTEMIIIVMRFEMAIRRT